MAEITGQSWRTVAIQLPPLATSAMANSCPSTPVTRTSVRSAATVAW